MKHKKKFSLDAAHIIYVCFSCLGSQFRLGWFFQYRAKKLPRNEKNGNWSFIPFPTVLLETMERRALKIMSDMGFNASLLNHIGKQQGRKTI